MPILGLAPSAPAPEAPASTLWSDALETYRAAVEAPRRVTASRVEALALSGASLGDVPCESVRVSFDGEQTEQWRASFVFTDPAMVPVSSSSALDGRSGTRLRVWWRVETPTGWLEVPCGTYVVEDPTITDSTALSTAVPGLDPLAVARRGRYGGTVINVGGLTVSAALARLFGVLVPGYPVSIDPSTVTLPEHYELWDRDPSEDWTEIAAMAGMRVRTDRWGVITVRPEPDPQALAADWQEGPACPVTDLSSTIKTSTIPRRVVVVSTSPDVTPVIVGQWINPDADELSLVTEQRIESSTVASQEAADNLARMTGERWRRPQQSVEVSVPARPDLGYRDRVALTRQRAAVSGVFAVGGWELSLAGPDTDPALMRVTMMMRQ